MALSLEYVESDHEAVAITKRNAREKRFPKNDISTTSATKKKTIREIRDQKSNLHQAPAGAASLLRSIYSHLNFVVLHRSRFKLIYRKERKVFARRWGRWIRAEGTYHHIDFFWHVFILPFCHFDGLINSYWSWCQKNIIMLIETWSCFMFALAEPFIRCHSFHPCSAKKTFNTRNIIRLPLTLRRTMAAAEKKSAVVVSRRRFVFFPLVYFWVFLLP